MGRKCKFSFFMELAFLLFFFLLFYARNNTYNTLIHFQLTNVTSCTTNYNKLWWELKIVYSFRKYLNYGDINVECIWIKTLVHWIVFVMISVDKWHYVHLKWRWDGYLRSINYIEVGTYLLRSLIFNMEFFFIYRFHVFPQYIIFSLHLNNYK